MVYQNAAGLKQILSLDLPVSCSKRRVDLALAALASQARQALFSPKMSGARCAWQVHGKCWEKPWEIYRLEPQFQWEISRILKRVATLVSYF